MTPELWNGEHFPLEGWDASWVGGGELPRSYLVAGPKKGPILMLIPGLAEPWHSYAPVLAELSQHFTVYAVDLRGHGHSGRSAVGAYDVVDYLVDLLNIIDTAISGPLTVAGNSLGALLAAGAAAARPDRVTGVILEDGPFFITEADRWLTHPFRVEVFGELLLRLQRRENEMMTSEQFSRVFADRPFAFAPRGGLMKRLRWAAKFFAHVQPLQSLMTPADMVRQEGAILRIAGEGTATWGEIFPAEVIMEVAAKYQKVDWGAIAAAARPVGFSPGFDHGAVLSAIACPVLVIEADPDLSGLLTEEDNQRLDRLTGPAKTTRIVIPNALHETHQSHPDDYVDAVKRFAARL